MKYINRQRSCCCICWAQCRGSGFQIGSQSKMWKITWELASVNWDESPVPFSCHHGVTDSVNFLNFSKPKQRVDDAPALLTCPFSDSTRARRRCRLATTLTARFLLVRLSRPSWNWTCKCTQIDGTEKATLRSARQFRVLAAKSEEGWYKGCSFPLYLVSRMEHSLLVHQTCNAILHREGLGIIIFPVLISVLLFPGNDLYQTGVVSLLKRQAVESVKQNLSSRVM